MIIHIIKDPWTYLCTLMIAAVQWVMVHVNVVTGIVMFIGAVATLLFRIRADIRKERHNKELREIEIEIKRQELNNLRNK